MWKRSRETIDHLLLQCKVDMTIWNAFSDRVGLMWVMPIRLVDLLANRSLHGNLQITTIWKKPPHGQANSTLPKKLFGKVLATSQ